MVQHVVHEVTNILIVLDDEIVKRYVEVHFAQVEARYARQGCSQDVVGGADFGQCIRAERLKGYCNFTIQSIFSIHT